MTTVGLPSQNTIRKNVIKEVQPNRIEAIEYIESLPVPTVGQAEKKSFITPLQNHNSVIRFGVPFQENK